ncbi:MAG: ATP-binding protein [Xanthobacteraceae bacterium]
MKPLQEWDEAFLERHFVQGKIQESNALDYKDSRSLGKQSPERSELCKDTSAFANSAGGMIVYGITENKHEPTGIDQGVDITAITKEYIEDVLTSNIRPKIEDLEIKVVPLPSKGANRVAVVLRIGQATALAPHQNVLDNKYYRRHNFKSEPMRDHEVRDAMRRSIAFGRQFGLLWNILVEVRRLRAAAAERHAIPGSDHIPRTTLNISVSNDLRSSGEAVIFLDKKDRKTLAELVKEVDEYNSIIETVDQGQRGNARLTESLKRKLYEMELRARDIAAKLEATVDSYE